MWTKFEIKFKEIINKPVTCSGIHPQGDSYEHGEGVVTDVWKVKDGFRNEYSGFGLRFQPNKGGGYIWPGIDKIELQDATFVLTYTNAFKQEGKCYIRIL